MSKSALREERARRPTALRCLDPGRSRRRCSSCTSSSAGEVLGGGQGIGGLRSFARVWIWIAFAVSMLVFAGMLRRSAQVIRQLEEGWEQLDSAGVTWGWRGASRDPGSGRGPAHYGGTPPHREERASVIDSWHGRVEV
jgi:hypothetical protein